MFSAVRDRYMRDGEGFMLVYSLTQRSTFLPMPRFYEQIKRARDTTKHVPVVLVGNKVIMFACCVHFVDIVLCVYILFTLYCVCTFCLHCIVCVHFVYIVCTFCCMCCKIMTICGAATLISLLF